MENLEKRIYVLEEKIKELEENYMKLLGNQNKIIISKQNNSKYPFWNLMLSLNISEEERTKIDYVLSIVDAKINNEVFNISRGAKDFLPSDLTDNSFTKINEIYDVLIYVTKRNKEQIFKILLAMYEQHIHKKTIEYILFNH